MANEYAGEAQAMAGVLQRGIEYETSAKMAEMERPLVVALRRGGNAGDELAMALSTLEERLRPVLAQIQPEPPNAGRGGDDVRVQHGDSDVVNQVHAQAHNTELQTQRVYRLLDRLEV